MKILCSYSGIEFDVSHFPGTFHSRELHHPIFSLDQKRLLSYTGKWAAGELTTTDSYLLFLALLHSSEQLEFRIPCKRNHLTDAIVAANMEYLVRTVIKLNTIRTPGSVFPSFAITQDTCTLSNVHYWIEIWEKCYLDFANGPRKDIQDRKLVHREAALVRMIKNPHKHIREYASRIADWASIAGSFPTFAIANPFSPVGKPSSKIQCDEYWREIIIRSTRNELLYSIPDNDLQELLDHCEDNIPAGSIFSHALFNALRNAQAKKKNFLGLGDFDLQSKYSLVQGTESAEAINMQALIDSAPTELPRLEQYPTKFAYMKAKMRWDISQKAARNNPSSSTGGENM